MHAIRHPLIARTPTRASRTRSLTSVGRRRRDVLGAHGKDGVVGPRWVRTASVTRGSRRARAVTPVKQKPQVTTSSGPAPRPLEQGEGGFESHPRHCRGSGSPANEASGHRDGPHPPVELESIAAAAEPSACPKRRHRWSLTLNSGRSAEALWPTPSAERLDRTEQQDAPYQTCDRCCRPSTPRTGQRPQRHSNHRQSSAGNLLAADPTAELGKVLCWWAWQGSNCDFCRVKRVRPPRTPFTALLRNASPQLNRHDNEGDQMVRVAEGGQRADRLLTGAHGAPEPHREPAGISEPSPD
jgi:hypothetical protein